MKSHHCRQIVLSPLILFWGAVAAWCLSGCSNKPPVTAAATIRAMAPAKQPDVDTAPVRDAVRSTRDAVRYTSSAIREVREAAEKAERDVAEAKRLTAQFKEAIDFYQTNKEVADRFRALQKEFERLRIRNIATVGDLKEKVYQAETRATRAESVVDGLRGKVDALQKSVSDKNTEAAKAQTALTVATNALETSQTDLAKAKADLAKAQQDVAALRKYQWMFWIAVGWLALKLAVWTLSLTGRYTPQGKVARLLF